MRIFLKLHFAQQIQSTFRSLKYRNYRLFFSGQGLSLIGTWMERIAISWLVYRLSGSAIALGFVAFAGQIPCFILAPVGGMVADRYNRHKVLLLTQILSMIQASVLAWLTVSGRVEIWHLMVLITILGSINAFDIPARQAFVVEMVENSGDLGNAIALNSSMFNAARLIGPMLAGIIISVSGEGQCFVINSISYLAVIVSLCMMKIRPAAAASKPVHPLWQLKNGLRYAYDFEPIRYIIALTGLISLAGMPYLVLMPIFTDKVLHGDSQTYGILMGTSGVGALIGAFYMASRKTVLGLGKRLVFAGMLFGTSLIFFSLSASLWLSMGVLLFSGFGMMILMAGCNTILQTMVDDDKRGMVMSFYMMAFMGAIPIGSLLAGYLAHHLGVHVTLLMGGVCCTVGSGLFAKKLPLLREMIRPIYIKKGIITEVAHGLQNATSLSIPPEE